MAYVERLRADPERIWNDNNLPVMATTYAMIAQAEQLQRIAAALENISGAYLIDLPPRNSEPPF